jgi:hypothetical protein
MTSPEATIRRGVRNARYAAIPNHVFEDMRLSMEARWLLCYLLSKPDNWIARIRDIRNVGNCGRDKATAMVNELIAAGYAEREQLRDTGKFGNTVLVIYDEPRPPELAENSPVARGVASLPQPDLPDTAQPDTVLPGPANPTPSKDLEITNTDSSNGREGARDASENEDDDSAWGEHACLRAMKKWPTGFDDSRSEALRAWNKLTIDKRMKAVRVMPDYIARVKASGRSKFCAFSKYLAEERFEALPERPGAPTKATEKAYGPAWAARCVELLLRGRGPIGLPEVTRASRIEAYRAQVQLRGVEAAQAFYRRYGHTFADDGTMTFPDDFEAQQQKLLILKNGYPRVVTLYDGQGLEGVEAIRGRALVPLMEFVPADTPMFAAWQAYYDGKPWPFPKLGSMRGLYFPAGGPDQLGAFERALRNDAA